MVKLFVTMARLACGQISVIMVKIGAAMGVRLDQSVQNVPACKYITPMGIEVVSASVKNVLTHKYIAPMGIEDV